MIALNKDLFRLDHTYYGGNQSWWGEATFKFGLLFDRRKKDVGCAPVAAANILAYLAGKEDGFSALYPYLYTKNDFRNMMDDVWEFVTPGPAGFWWAGDFSQGIQRYARQRGIDLESVILNGHCASKTDLEKVVSYISAGLARDCPIALNVHFNTKLTAGGQSFSLHWMVITALMDQRDAEGNGSIIVSISSWGNKYELDLRTIVEDSSYWGMVYFTGC